MSFLVQSPSMLIHLIDQQTDCSAYFGEGPNNLSAEGMLLIEACRQPFSQALNLTTYFCKRAVGVGNILIDPDPVRSSQFSVSL